MVVTSRLEDRESRCRHHLLKLRMLALRQDGTIHPPQLAAEVRTATNAIIAEAEAMSHASFGVGNQPEPGAETFLWVRISRLVRAADQLVDAARRGDSAELRSRLRRFDALNSAIWTVLALRPRVTPARERP